MKYDFLYLPYRELKQEMENIFKKKKWNIWRVVSFLYEIREVIVDTIYTRYFSRKSNSGIFLARSNMFEKNFPFNGKLSCFPQTERF